MIMDIAKRLNNELLNQTFTHERQCLEELNKCKQLAQGYANIENALAVLSDMHTNNSHIYYGGFAQTLGLSPTTEEQHIGSIWEEDILKRIHPDDLYSKCLLELRYFHFIKHLPRSKRGDYYLMEKLRMKDTHGGYLPVCHRMFYIIFPSEATARFALCLYTPLSFEVPSNGCVVHTTTGRLMELERSNDSRILSEREKQVLRLIDKGMMSKHIADKLSISINTVSRHRQEILNKLKVKNSIEACRVAKDLRII